MKKLALIVLCAAAVSACGVSKRMEKREPLKVTPGDVEVIFDRTLDPVVANIEYQVEIPPKYVATRAQVILQPLLTDGRNVYRLTPLKVNGKTYEKLERRKVFFGEEFPRIMKREMDIVEGKNGTVVKLSDAIPFEPWMADAKLFVNQYYAACGVVHPKSSTLLAENVKLLVPEPIVVERPVVVVVEAAPVVHKREYVVGLNYRVGSAVIDPALDANKQVLDGLKSFMGGFVNDKHKAIDHVVVIGYGSPDGPYALNKKLSAERAQKVREYLLANYKSLKPASVEHRNVAEDWDGLRILIEGSSLQAKQDVLRIIDSSQTPDTKEAELKKMGATYHELAQKYLPELRKVVVQVYYTKTE